MTADEPRPPVTISQLAERTGLHRNTIVRDIGDGTTGILPAVKIGQQWQIDADIADAYASARDLVTRGENALTGLRAWAQQRGTPRDRRR